MRGQAGKTPVAIKFLKDDGSQPLNNGVYEIVNIIDNKNIVLTSESDFVAETNLQVVILGTVPLGKVFTDAQMEGLYTYDWFTLGLTQEVTLEQPPTKSVNEFYIARVRNNGGTVTIDNTAKRNIGLWQACRNRKNKKGGENEIIIYSKFRIYGRTAECFLLDRGICVFHDNT